MPQLSRLHLHDFRNLSLSLTFSGGLNVLYGANGSGKTSLLEGIYFLSRGRSFRTARLESMVRRGRQRAEVRAVYIATGEQELRIRLFADGKKELQFNGKPVSAPKSLGRIFPLVFTDPHNINLVAAAPLSRRLFLEGLLFYVEQNYGSRARDYRLCLRQRRMLLRQKPHSYDQCRDWDAALARQAEEVEALRAPLIAELLRHTQDILRQCAFVHTVQLRYLKGWEGDIAQALRQSFTEDVRRGWTTRGCHRADILIRIQDENPLNFLSLGQQKMLSLAFFLAVQRQLRDHLKTPVLFLLDDILPFLDERNGTRLLRYLAENEIQTLMTDMEATRVRSWANCPPLAMFHVEHL